MIVLRQRAGQTALLVLGGALGAIAAFEAARFFELRLAQEMLLQYAHHALRVTEFSASEAVASAKQFSSDGMEFCSDDEIAAMRRFVYNAAFVKDLGRVRDGMLYCTSTLGRAACHGASCGAALAATKDSATGLGCPRRPAWQRLFAAACNLGDVRRLPF